MQRFDINVLGILVGLLIKAQIDLCFYISIVLKSCIYLLLYFKLNLAFGYDVWMLLINKS